MFIGIGCSLEPISLWFLARSLRSLLTNPFYIFPSTKISRSSYFGPKKMVTIQIELKLLNLVRTIEFIIDLGSRKERSRSIRYPILCAILTSQLIFYLVAIFATFSNFTCLRQT